MIEYYKKRIEYYKKRIGALKKQVVAYADMGNDAKVSQLNKDIRDFENSIEELTTELINDEKSSNS